MNAIELVVKGNDKPVALACGECGTVHSLSDVAGAEQCCKPYVCTDCGVECKRYRTRCSDCLRKRGDEREAERFRAAKHIEWTEAGAMLYDRNGDRWIDAGDVEDMLLDGDAIEYAYASTPMAFRIDAESIVESALEEHHEGAHESITNTQIDALQAFVDSWCADTGVVSYQPDYSRVVVFPRRNHD